jgi:hypothetical protein
VERYLKRYYGTRAAQCKALLQMLSWVEDRAAIQVLLATSARFRTAGIRQEAERLVHALAGRREWTVEQLADRTIPLSDDRRQAQAILRKQKERLYEALCTQRSWRFADWRDLLLGHPLVRRHCERLVWSVWDGGTLAATFRPLDDGTLTDVMDEAVTVEPTATVRLAHSCTLPAEVAESWRRHLADYGVQPLFDQLGPVRTLQPELRMETELADFRGHLLESFALRGKATQLGYTRGPVDSGIFSFYLKPFAGLGLTACIEFTGSFLPQINHTVALVSLSFVYPPKPGSFLSQQVPLGEIPPVLLSECRNDMAALAAQGTGYDPAWQKKTELR